MAGEVHEKEKQDQLKEEDYIDMDISSINSCTHSIDFEFQLSPPVEMESTTSPADELFYQGKLLPLHLPPRLQMVQKILNTTKHYHEQQEEIEEAELSEESFTTTTDTDTDTNTEVSHLNPKKPLWCKKLKLMRHSTLSLKLKAPKDYIRSLFSKPACSDEAKESTNGHSMEGKKKPFGKFKKDVKQFDSDTKVSQRVLHRSSFSGAIDHNVEIKHSTNRNSSVELENPIQGAIAHCKKSFVPGRKSASDIGHCTSLRSSARIAAACESMERPGICRG